MDVFKVMGIALCGVGLSGILKQYQVEYQIFAALSCGLVLLVFSLGYMQEIFRDLSGVVSRAGIKEGYFALILKAVGVSCLCEVGVNLCKDAGESAIASKLEFAGKMMLLYFSLPVFVEVLGVLTSLMD